MVTWNVAPSGVDTDKEAQQMAATQNIQYVYFLDC